MASECTCKRRECRKGRPLCAARRRTSPRYRNQCNCGAYAFPHRPDAGRCNPEVINRLLWGEMPAASAAE
jgi:hypothetical protein